MRESVFNIVQHYIEDAKFLDLFAGSGAMGIEALSRGASHATFIDRDFLCVQCIRKNLESVGFAEKATIVKQDVFRAVQKLEGPFDLIYIDPPYQKDRVTSHQCHDLIDLIESHQLLSADGILFLEYSHPITIEHLNSRSREFGSSYLNQFSFPSNSGSQ